MFAEIFNIAGNFKLRTIVRDDFEAAAYCHAQSGFIFQTYDLADGASTNRSPNRYLAEHVYTCDELLDWYADRIEQLNAETALFDRTKLGRNPAPELMQALVASQFFQLVEQSRRFILPPDVTDRIPAFQQFVDVGPGEKVFNAAGRQIWPARPPATPASPQN